MRRCRIRHADATRYTAYVLWLIGFSERSIARTLGLGTKQIAGMIRRSDYKDRTGMTDGQRQAFLSELEASRVDVDGKLMDRGMLRDIPFCIRALRAVQRRPASRKTT